MPLWTSDELQKAALVLDLGLDDDEIDTRVKGFGGTARFSLSRDTSEVTLVQDLFLGKTTDNPLITTGFPELFKAVRVEDRRADVRRPDHRPWYYAVASGYTLGVFTDLEDALDSTYGYSNSLWQKFPTFGEAEEFLHANGVIVKRLAQRRNGELTWTAYDVMDPNVEAFVAFCDGSALRNGRADCTAAYAALFPHNQAWNEVEVLRDTYATSNRAEYSAALAVMKRAAVVDPGRSRPVIIFTDSELLVNTMENFINKWLRNGWTTANGGPVKNRDLLEDILHVATGRVMMFRHVRAHTGRQEWEYSWNDKADCMAREAARNWDDGYY
ncbi:hypothetical protein PR001_g21688 [Phytophthora rubi]|uniref:ribonuclease H n=1 Tax=Phytophthora rubi TaxID=129364 RepID=A0A6A3J5S4_9STRA|nr:hypothetical protein PR001_g21688 [Phytophthora rubi]